MVQIESQPRSGRPVAGQLRLKTRNASEGLKNRLAWARSTAAATSSPLSAGGPRAAETSGGCDLLAPRAAIARIQKMLAPSRSCARAWSNTAAAELSNEPGRRLFAAVKVPAIHLLARGG